MSISVSGSLVDSMASTLDPDDIPAHPAGGSGASQEPKSKLPEVDTTPLLEAIRLTGHQLDQLRQFQRLNQTTLNELAVPTVFKKELLNLPRSVLVIPQKGSNAQVVALLKRKKGNKALSKEEEMELELGRGAYKTATLSVDIGSQRLCVFQSEYIGAKGPIKPVETHAMEHFKHKSRVVGGTSVRYETKARGSQTSISRTGFLVEYCDGGDLENYLIANKNPPKIRALEVDEVALIAFDIAVGIFEIHKEGYVHRDIKPANVLLLTEAGKLRAKVGDLSFCGKEAFIKGESVKGTPGYLDPYVCRQIKVMHKNPSLDQRSDIWSLGATLWELSMGHTQVCGATMGYKAENLNYFWPGGSPDVSPEGVLAMWKSKNLQGHEKPGTLKYIIGNCLKFQPEERWSALQVKEALAQLISQEPSASAAAV
ncbi:MAG: protein kinase family protein [Chlamydiia bacterium]|nr:protein kinase family protein [Chlamydiia bacterium]